MDIYTKEKRREIMGSVKSKDTTPEKKIRSLLHALGYRFRLHRKDLPGRPDIVLPKYYTVIFVHGCFWHRHPGCKRASLPTSNVDYWEKKFERNVERDKENKDKLLKKGWKVLTIWECELKDTGNLIRIIEDCIQNKS
jgi:DNA mismatch endonuclease (patch repair protein)